MSSEQWNQLLSVLSLDGVVRFYEPMCVPVIDKTIFQRTLRQVIVEARRQFSTMPDRIPPFEAMLFEQVSGAEAGPLRHWAQRVFLGYHPDQPEWSAWDIVFSQWAYSRRKDLSFLPEPKWDWIVTSYQREAITDDVKKQAEDVLKQPMSDWDLEMFARRGWGASWESGPYSLVEAIIRVERLKRFSAKVWSRLGPAEREALIQAGQSLISDLHVWMPGALPRLDDLLKEA